MHWTVVLNTFELHGFVGCGSKGDLRARQIYVCSPLQQRTSEDRRNTSEKCQEAILASHLNEKRPPQLAASFPILELTWAHLCTQMAGYIENAETRETA